MKERTKSVTYKSTNTYETLNEFTEKTKNVWIVFHGIGYLSRYFLTYFDELPREENYIIAPQAPSKYYLKNEYKYVGASWLTKENTNLEIENVLSYLNSVLKAEQIPATSNLIVFGFSQGVSIATRWLSKTKLNCSKLILYAGGIPNELTASDFKYLIENKTEVQIVVGRNDEYLTPKRMEIESRKIESLFNGKAKQLVFEGGHEIKKEIINALV
ncbi:alpha/beta hydrolase [Maribacter aestuarii]|uniref:alpha/beta hydrolase n=1 Tax=Maribacter aestuarii TaxID=1130723 RepID=UPI0025A56E17|nr:esterase [Maribacter aestuarii]